MAKPVSLKDVESWLEKNRHRTWNVFTGGPTDLSFEIKYLDIGFDTRDMKVFCLESRPAAATAHVGDDFEGTLLELLESKLDQRKDNA